LTFNKASSGGAVYAGSASTIAFSTFTFNYSTVTFEANEANRGGAIYSSYSLVSINNSKIDFSTNTAENGGAIYLTNAFIKADNSEVNFTSNTATENGGAVYAIVSTLSFNASSKVLFSFNTAIDGGAIYATRSSISFDGSTISFTENTASNGGAVYADSSKLDFNNSSASFTENNASAQGGAIYAAASTIAFDNSNGDFTDNSAIDGGAVYANSSSISFNSSTMNFIGNDADYGGAVYADNAKTSFNNSSANFMQNGASVHGGAIYTENSTISFNNSIGNFIANDAQRGGAVYVNKSSFSVNASTINFTLNSGDSGGAIYGIGAKVLFNASSVNFIQNSVSGKGGAVYASNPMTIAFNNSNGNFINNSALYGGAIYASDGSSLSFNASTINWDSNDAADGGAIYADNGSKFYFNNSSANFTQNNAADGGAVYAGLGSRILFNASTIIYASNLAQNGAAIYAADGSTISFNNSSAAFESNIASLNGGAIYVESGSSISFNNSIVNFTQNSAVGGGAVYLSENSTISFYNTSAAFRLNQANGSANDILFDGATLNIDSDKTIFFGGGLRSSDLTKLNIINKKGSGDMIIGNDAITDMGNSRINLEKGAIVIQSSFAALGRQLTVADGSTFTIADIGGNVWQATVTVASATVRGTLNFGLDLRFITSYASNLLWVNEELTIINGSSITIYSATPWNGGYDGGALHLIESPQLINNIEGFYFYDPLLKLVWDNDSAVKWIGIAYKIIWNPYADAWNGNTGVSVSSVAIQKTIRPGQDDENPFGSPSTDGFLFDGQNHTLDSYSTGGYVNKGFTLNAKTAYFRDITFKSFAKTSSSDSGNGGAFYLSNGATLDFQQSTITIFTANTALSSGGAVFANASRVELGSATPVFAIPYIRFENNLSTKGAGGAIYAQNDSYISALESSIQFISNTALNGGAFYINQSSVLFNNATANFERNRALGNGGAIIITANSTAAFDGGTITFTSNSAISGGAIYTNFGSSLSFTNSEVSFTSNSAANGGAIYISSGVNISIINNNIAANFEFNRAVLGGALYLANGVSHSFEGAAWKFDGNSATNGGAVYLASQSSAAFHTNFTENTAQRGGAFYVENSAQLLISGAIFRDNRASQEGGAIYVNGGTLILDDRTGNIYFIDNSAQSAGNDIFLNGGKMNANLYVTGHIISIRGGIRIANNGEFNIGGDAAGQLYFGGQSIIDGNINVNTGTFIIDNASVNYNSGIWKIDNNSNLAGAYIDNAIVNTKGETIIRNGAGVGGYGMEMQQSTMIFNGSLTIENNVSDYGIFSANASSITIALTFILKDNEVTIGNGQLNITNSSLDLRNAQITAQGNKVSASGANGGTFYFENIAVEHNGQVEFTSNSANGSGGAVYIAQDGNIGYYGNTQFNWNTANSGGALAISGNNAIGTIKNAAFKGNTAADGGAVSVNNASALFEDIRFKQNQASSGAAVHLTSANVRFIANNSDLIFDANIALNNGGAIYIEYSSALFHSQNQNINFTNNRAQFEGASVDNDIYMAGNSYIEFKTDISSINVNGGIISDGGANTIVKSGAGELLIGGFNRSDAELKIDSGTVKISPVATIPLSNYIFGVLNLNPNGALNLLDPARESIKAVFSSSVMFNGGTVLIDFKVFAKQSDVIETNYIEELPTGILKVNFLGAGQVNQRIFASNNQVASSGTWIIMNERNQFMDGMYIDWRPDGGYLMGFGGSVLPDDGPFEHNETEVAKIITKDLSGGGESLTNSLVKMGDLNDADKHRALRQMSGEFLVNAIAQGAQNDAAMSLLDKINDEAFIGLRTWDSGNIWAEGYKNGAHLGTEHDSNSIGDFRKDGLGMRAGWDVIKTKTWMGGVYTRLGYTKMEQVYDKADVYEAETGIYGGYFFGDYAIKAMLGFGINNYNAVRDMRVLKAKAESQWTTQNILFALKGEYKAADVEIPEIGKTEIKPFIALIGDYASNGDIKEEGAQELNLEVKASAYTHLETLLGAGIGQRTVRTNWQARVYGGYIISGAKPTKDIYFAQAKQYGAMDIWGIDVHPFSIGLGGNYEYSLNNNWSIYLGGDFNFGVSKSAYFTDLGARYKFSYRDANQEEKDIRAKRIQDKIDAAEMARQAEIHEKIRQARQAQREREAEDAVRQAQADAEVQAKLEQDIELAEQLRLKAQEDRALWLAMQPTGESDKLLDEIFDDLFEDVWDEANGGIDPKGNWNFVIAQDELGKKTTLFYFDHDSNHLNDAAKARVQEYVNQMDGKKEKIIIVSRVDRTGPKENDKELSRNRAMSVSEAFLEAGADMSKISYTGRYYLDPQQAEKQTAGLGGSRNVPLFYFDTDEYSLNDEGKAMLKKYSMKRKGKKITLTIEGYTDTIGGEQYNKRLSDQRAKAVYDELVSNGVKVKSIKYIGKYYLNPIGDNETQDGRAKNRRTNIVEQYEID
jgi:predicted outer membrane repeat protein